MSLALPLDFTVRPRPEPPAAHRLGLLQLLSDSPADSAFRIVKPRNDGE